MGSTIAILIAINLFVSMFYAIYCLCEYDIVYFPIWRMIWHKAPLILIGKIIVSVLLGIVFLPADICWFIILTSIRIIRHIGYAFWWIFAEDRQDVQERWKDFWDNRRSYYCGKIVP